MRKFSVVVPCYNEQEVLPRFASEFFSCAEKCESFETIEVIFVDDGSRDQTWPIIEELIANSEGQIRGIQLSRNFGHQAALLAGLERTYGDVIGVIDADLQDQPKILFAMLDKLVTENDVDCVYGKRLQRALHSTCYRKGRQPGR